MTPFLLFFLPLSFFLLLFASAHGKRRGLLHELGEWILYTRSLLWWLKLEALPSLLLSWRRRKEVEMEIRLERLRATNSRRIDEQQLPDDFKPR